MEKNFEIWTVYSGSGRPDRFLDEFASLELADEYVERYLLDNPADEVKIGSTRRDPDGFLQWKNCRR